MGSTRYLRPAAAHIDQAIERYLPFQNGFYVEAGANDGFTQSNTYYLEKRRGWRGVLVEPVPHLYKECKQARPRSYVFHCALVPFNHTEPTVTVVDANLMSIVKGARKSISADWEHIRLGETAQPNVQVAEYQVPARTLNSILDEVGATTIDLLSLDVEGYELQVLQGLDLNKYRPQFILIEANFRQEIDAHLQCWYDTYAVLSEKDILYRRKE